MLASTKARLAGLKQRLTVLKARFLRPTHNMGSPNSGCLQRKLQRPYVAYILLCALLVLVALQAISLHVPNRSFPDTPRLEHCDNCFPYAYDNRLEPKGLCAGDGDVDMVLLITTIPTEEHARDVIRSTWCNITAVGATTARCVFLFGVGYSLREQHALDLEASRHNDVLQEWFLDSYYNLSIKVLMGYHWLMRRCPRAKYVVRTAGDNYVHIPQLLELVHKKGKQLEDSMFGDCFATAAVWRWPFHRWVVSFKEYPHLLFPPYCIGTTFVTSYKLMTEIVKISVNVPYFPIEDVYFGMCLQQYNNKYQVADVEGFSAPLVSWSDRFSIGMPKECSFESPWYSIHDVTPGDINRIWKACHGSKVRPVKRLSPDDDEDLMLNSITKLRF